MKNITDLSLDITTPLPKAYPQNERIAFYAKWLQQNAQWTPDVSDGYRKASLAANRVGKRIYLTFAPFNKRMNALQVVTPAQIVIIASLFLTSIGTLIFFRLAFLTAILGAITLLYLIGFVTSSVFVWKSRQSCETIDEQMITDLDTLGVDWPSYTILCPLYKEAAIVPQFLEAIKALKYPANKLQVLFLTEIDDDATRTVLARLPLPSYCAIKVIPESSPRTKPRACNLGLLLATGQFIVIFDAEDKPDPLQLKKAVLTFANCGPETACVQAKLNYYNASQNTLTRLFTAEYSTWFNMLLPGLQRSKCALPLGGTSNHFRTEILRALGGWDAFNVTEDCDLGLRIFRYGLKTALLDSTTEEEATSTLKAWILQRSRWIKGYLQTYLVYMRHPGKLLHKSWQTFLSVQIITGAWTSVLLLNPLMWLLTAIYLVFRPVALYSLLFPGPILYLGSLCLIFGNFFYLYVHMLGCLRKRNYTLIKWVLLLPIYWFFMSIAAYIALIQLVAKPHYWQKTQHGLHLQQQDRLQVSTQRRQDRKTFVSSLPTFGLLPAIRAALTTQEVRAIKSNLYKRLDTPKPRQKANPLKRLVQDRWFVATMLIAVVASIGATIYSFQHHLILIYGDANSHLEIARRLLDNLTPGLAQLGGVWLPLPHLLMFPFAQNDYLWQTGLAGSIVGMSCYLITAGYMFHTIKRITKNSCVSFIGSLFFLLNPNILYLQSTPLTEPVCWATYTAASYYLLTWAQEGKNKYLVFTAITTFLATLARYDGWILVLTFPCVIAFTDWQRRASLQKIIGDLLVFFPLSSFGIVLWLIWNKIIFGDPLYFQRGPFSSQTQTGGTLSTQFQSQPLLDVRILGICTIETVGILAFVLALAGTLVYILRRWKARDTLATLTHWAPFVFYLIAIYHGQVNLLDSQAHFYPLGIIPIQESVNLFNSRYGSEMVVPTAIFLVVLIPPQAFSSLLGTFSKASLVLTRCTLIAFIIAQSLWIAYGGVISIISNINPPFCAGNYAVMVYLQEHYNGGFILATEYPFHFTPADASIDFNQVIYEGSQRYWIHALNNPSSTVNWIIFSQGDSVSRALAHTLQDYTLVAQTRDGLRLYHKNGLPPLPTRPISSYLQSEQAFCTVKQ